MGWYCGLVYDISRDGTEILILLELSWNFGIIFHGNWHANRFLILKESWDCTVVFLIGLEAGMESYS